MSATSELVVELMEAGYEMKDGKFKYPPKLFPERQTGSSEMSDTKSVKWIWGRNNLHWTYGREVMTSLGPAFGLCNWVVLIPEDGCPTAIIPQPRAKAGNVHPPFVYDMESMYVVQDVLIDWLNTNDARLELSNAPTVSADNLAPGINQVTVAVPGRLWEIDAYRNREMYGVFRAWVWSLEGYQPRIELPQTDALVYYPKATGTPDLLTMAQLHSTLDWPAFAVPQFGDTTVEPWEPLQYSSKAQELRWCYDPLPELQWAFPFDWRVVVQGVRTILTHQLRQRSDWHECTRCFGFDKYYRSGRLIPLGTFEEGWEPIEETFRRSGSEEPATRIKRIQPLLRPYLASGRCPKCGSVTYPCEESKPFDGVTKVRSTSYAARYPDDPDPDQEAAEHLEELSEWQPGWFD